VAKIILSSSFKLSTKSMRSYCWQRFQ